MQLKPLQEAEKRLNDHLPIQYLKVLDDSAKHEGHIGGRHGAKHGIVILVSEAFEGKSLVDRHRRVYEILKDLIPARIHALQLKTYTPQEAKTLNLTGEV